VDGSHNPPQAVEFGKPMLSARNIQRRAILFDNYRFISEVDFALEQRRTQIATNDVLLTIVGTIGRVAVVKNDTPEFALQRSVAVLRPSLAITPQYLGYALESPRIQQHFIDTAKGTAQKGVYLKALGELEVELAPLAEQVRIVNQLDTLLARVQACNDRFDAIPALLKRFRQTVLSAAVSGALTKEWRLNQHVCPSAETLLLELQKNRPENLSSEPRSLDGLFSLPANWRWTNLHFLLSPDEPFCYGVVQPGADDPQGVFLVRAGDLKEGTVDVSNLRRIPVNVDKEYRRSKLRGGELLVTVVGAGIGESSIAPPETAGFNIARAVAKLPLRDVSANYVHLWLLSTMAIQIMKSDAREVARPTLNLEQLKTLPVPMPALSEQAEIVRRVEALFALADRIEVSCTVARAQAQRLTPLVLAKAFRGELVPQDPNDEPASALLARIASSNTAVAGKNKRKVPVVLMERA